MIKLSIIVPVYNVEDYILECMESIINQSLREIEIIVVNDGSTDNSIKKLEQIKDSRIKLINKKNGGLSSARNEGLRVATGQYLIFIDSDDFLMSKDCLQQMYNDISSNNLDILSSNAKLYYKDNNKYIKTNKGLTYTENKVMSIDEFIEKSQNCDIAPVCFYMYRTKFLKGNNLSFKEGIYHEDELFTYKALLKTENIYVSNEYFYAYRQRDGSITSSKNNIKRGLDIIDICLELEKDFENIKNKEIKMILCNRGFNMILESVLKYNIKKIDINTKKYLIKHSKSIKDKVRACICILSPSIYKAIISRGV